LLAAVSAGAGTGRSVTGDEHVDSESVTESDWTMWRFNRSNTGFNPHISRIEEFSFKWDSAYDAAAGSGNLYSPSVTEDTLYYGTFDERMHAVDLATGDQVWTVSVGDIIQSSPTILEGTVYSGSHDGNIYAWDANTGVEEWSIVGGGTGNRHTSVTVSQDRDTIYIGSDRSCFSLVPETGEVNWEFTSPNHLISSPTLIGTRVFFGSGAPEDSGDGYVHALDDNGSSVDEIWQRYFPDANVRSTAAATNDDIFVATLGTSSSESASTESHEDFHRDDFGVTPETTAEETSGTVWSLKADTGDVNWTYEAGSAFSSPAVAEGLVFVGVNGTGSRDSQVLALGQTSGDLVWSHDLDGYMTASPAYADGVVYIGAGSRDGHLYAFDTQSGDVLNRVSIGGSVYSPVVTDNEIYVANSNTEVYALSGADDERGIGGTVTVDGDPLSNTGVYVYEPQRLHELLSYITLRVAGGDPTPPQSEYPIAYTNSGGDYSLTSLDRGPYVMLVVPPDDTGITPVATIESVVVEEGLTGRDFALENRPLGSLDFSIGRLFGEAEGLIGRHTGRAAEISVSGVSEFEAVDRSVQKIADTVTLLDTTLSYPEDTDPEVVQSQLSREVRRQNLSIDSAPNGIFRVLRNIFDNLDEETLDALLVITRAMTDEDWVEEFIYQGGERAVEAGLESTPFYESALGTVQDQRNRYDELVRTEPSEGFDIGAAEERIDFFYRQLNGAGLPNAIITPSGSIYQYEQSEAYAQSFEGTQGAIDAIETAEKVAHATQAVGAALIALGVSAPVGATLVGIGKKGDFATDVAQPLARLKLALDWVLVLVHWGVDLQDIEDIVVDLMDWLETSVEEGTPPVSTDDVSVESIDLNLVESGLRTNYVDANRPDDPEFGSSLPFLGEPLWAVNDAEIEISNDSDDPIEVRVGLHDIRDDGTTADAGTIEPGPKEPPLLIPANSSRTITTEYSTAHHNIIDNHRMKIGVFSEGQEVVFTTERFNVVVTGVGSQEYYAVTSANQTHNERLTAEQHNGNTPSESVVLEADLTPQEPRVEETFTTDSDTDSVLFTSASSGISAMRVYDEQGRSTGYDPETDSVIDQIPDAVYTGPNSNPEFVRVPEGPSRDYTIEVNAQRFPTDSTTSVEVTATEVPQREALLSVAPAESQAFVAPGETESRKLELSEVGRQVEVRSGTLSVGEFRNAEGTRLPGEVEVSLSRNTFELRAGESSTADLIFDAAEDLTLPENEPHRFEGSVVVETENAGSLEVVVSALVLSTDVGGAGLLHADRSVDRMTVTEATRATLETEAPDGVDPVEIYEVESDGSGAAGVSIPRPSDEEWLFAYSVGEEWRPLGTGSVEEELQVDLEDGTLEQDIVIASNELRRYRGLSGTVETEQVRGAVGDWRAGDIDTELLRDTIDYWRTGKEVP
jgi:outer membrane protein assembly factor BamB